MSEEKKNAIEEITSETPIEKEAQTVKPRKRVSNWKERIYYVVNQENGDVVADDFKDEKTCKEWIASGASQFDTPYVICYSVQSIAPITKTQKTILKQS